LKPWSFPEPGAWALELRLATGSLVTRHFYNVKEHDVCHGVRG